MTLVLNAKRLILVGLVILCNSLSSHAQKNNSDDLSNHIPKRLISRVEFSIGSNLTLVGGDQFAGVSRMPKFGLRATIDLIHTFNERFDLGLQLSYDQKGSKYKVYSENPGPPATDKVITTVTMNYATATLLPRYSVIPDHKLDFGVGPYFSYLINTKLVLQQYYQGTLVNRYSTRPDPDITYKDFDYGGAITAATRFALKNQMQFTLQFMYSFGLVDYNKPVVAAVRNNTFSLLVGISLQK